MEDVAEAHGLCHRIEVHPFTGLETDEHEREKLGRQFREHLVHIVRIERRLVVRTVREDGENDLRIGSRSLP